MVCPAHSLFQLVVYFCLAYTVQSSWQEVMHMDESDVCSADSTLTTPQQSTTLMKSFKQNECYTSHRGQHPQSLGFPFLPDSWPHEQNSFSNWALSSSLASVSSRPTVAFPCAEFIIRLHYSLHKTNLIGRTENLICSSLIHLNWQSACGFQQPSVDHLYRSSVSIPLWFPSPTPPPSCLFHPFVCLLPSLCPGADITVPKELCDGNEPWFSSKDSHLRPHPAPLFGCGCSLSHIPFLIFLFILPPLLLPTCHPPIPSKITPPLQP